MHRRVNSVACSLVQILRRFRQERKLRQYQHGRTRAVKLGGGKLFLLSLVGEALNTISICVSVRKNTPGQVSGVELQTTSERLI